MIWTSPFVRKFPLGTFPWNWAMKTQSEHIGQWATPHHLSDVCRGAPSWIWDYLAHSDIIIYVYRMLYMHDRRLGGIGRVVSIARCSRCSDWFVIAERLSYVSVRTLFQRRRFGLDIAFHQIHPRHDRWLGGIGRVVPIDENPLIIPEYLRSLYRIKSLLKIDNTIYEWICYCNRCLVFQNESKWPCFKAIM